ncbi:MAG: class I SAM-dependent RNA methyltransferase [Alphaproteobacteria bacterium]
MRKRFNKKKQKINIPPTDVVVESVGVKGDGIARDGDGNLLFIPYGLAGEKLTVKPIKKRGDGYLAEILSIIEKSDFRIDPFCKHFTECGGCKLQHMDLNEQAKLKHKNISGAFKSQDLDVEINPVQQIDAKRRRVRFNIIKAGNKYSLHFNKIQSNNVVKINSCDVLDEELFKVANEFITVFSEFDAPTKMDMQLTKGDNGIEIVFYPFTDKSLELEGRELIVKKVNELNITGVYWYWDGFMEPVCVKSDLIVNFSGHNISQPPAGFLQPSIDGQEKLVKTVVSLLEKYKVKDDNKIADLFSGSGMFSYGLVSYGTVDAFEINKPAIDKMNKNKAINPKVSGYERDLSEKPLITEECNKYDVVVLDPARSGAFNQVSQLSDSNCPLIIYVSCNPIALAKDTKVLLDGGYSVSDITPIDQFMYTDHAEVIAVFKK